MVGNGEAKQLIAVAERDGDVYLNVVNLRSTPLEEAIAVLSMEDIPELIVLLRSVYDGYKSAEKGDAQ